MNKLITKLLLGVLFVFGAVGVNAQVTVTGCTGAGNGSYTTLNAAATAIVAAQPAANIVITISGNTTEGTATSTFVAGTWTTLTISPTGGSWTISGATTAGNPMIDFSGSDNVTVDGLNSGGNALTIENTTVAATSGTSTIRFIGGATNNIITRCSLKGSGTMSVATNGAVVFFSTDAVTANGNDNNTISNCDIGPAGANLPTKAILGNGSTTTTAIGNSGIIITNNDIHDFFGAAVTSSAIATNGGCNTWTITNNRFYQTGTRTWTTGATHRAIDINNSTATSGAQAFTITGNTVGYASNTQTGVYTLTGSTGKFQAIQFTGITLGTVSNINSNTVASVSLTGVTSSGTTTSSPFTGILISNGVVNTNSNTIGSQSATGSLTFSTTTTTATDVYGMLNFGSDAWTTTSNNIGGITANNAGATGAFIVYGIRCWTGSGVAWTASSNLIGGTIANSIQNNSTSTTSQLIGMNQNAPATTWTLNTIRNLTAAGGTGTTTSASVIGISSTGTTPSHTLSQNTIHNLNNTNATAATVVTGIQFNGSTANVVERNSIHSLTSATTSTSAEINGIRVAGGTTIYRNNMIAIGAGVANAIGTAASNSNTSGVNGINEFLGTNSFFHNSVYIGGAPTSGVGASYAFNGTQTTNTRSFRDNIFFNARSNSGATGKHYAIKINGTVPNPVGLTINNNVYFANGTGAVFGFFNSLDVANIAAWKVAVGQDAGSYEGNPQYNDPTNATPDLHLHPTNVTVAEGNGVDVGVTLDYDGQTRASFTPVDIGADAGNFTGVDLTLPAISYTNLTNTTSTANRTTSSFATITDASGINTTIGTRPRIYYKLSTDANAFNDNTSGTAGWKYAEASGTTSPFDFTIDYSLLFGAPPIVIGNNIQYFVVAQDLAATPNVGINSGTFAAIPASVALTGAAFPIGGTINSYTILASIGGTITVPGTYPSLTLVGGAFEAINAAVVTSNITIEIAADLVAEDGTVKLNAFASPYTVTIKPVTSPRSITGSSTNSIIGLNGADRVTIDGAVSGSSKDLTIENTNTSTNTAVIWVSSLGTGLGATNNTIKNCIIKAGSNTVTSTFGIHAGGTTISTSGTGNDNDDLTIDNNTIIKAYYGIYAQAAAAGVNNNLTITGNTIGSATAADYVRFRGLLVSQATAAIVRQNTVFNIEHSVTNLRGMEFGTGFVSSTVSRNLIYNVNYTASANSGGKGMTFNPGAGVGTININNNVIYGLKGHASVTATNNTWGIMLESGTAYNIYFNSVNISDNRTTVSPPSNDFSGAFYIAAAVTSVDVRNNAFSCTALPAGTGKTYAIYCLAPNTAFTTINYNDFYAPGTSNRFAGFLTSDRTTIADIIAGFGQNANSFVTDPIFNSNTNLIPQLGSPLSATGDNSTGITIDYLGTTRTNPPTIGAYDVAADAAPPVITYTALTSTCATGDRVLTATITDALGVPTSGTLMPRIYYRKNSDPYFSSQGVLASGSGTSGTWTFTIVAADMGGVASPDVISYYVIAQDIAAPINIGSNPAAGLVATDVNTVSTPPTTPNTYAIQNVLAAGTYSVGGAGTYLTLTAAITAYNTSCLGGAVVFELLDPVYAEAAPMTIAANADASATNTLTIRPATGVTAAVSTTAPSGAVLKILSKYVTIDGSNNATTSRDLTISNLSATSPNVIWIGSTGVTPVTNNTVKNCIIINGANTSTAVLVSDGTVSGTAGYFNNITIQNNDIQRAFYGVFATGVVAAGNGSGTLITANDMITAGANSIRIGGIFAGGIDGATITNNNISNIVNANAESPRAITLSTGTINATVSGNTISTLSLTNTGAVALTGIYVNPGVTAASISINNNTVTGLANSGSSLAFAAILSFSPNTSITNNTVSGITQNHGTAAFWGIVQSGNVNGNVSGNNISGVTTAGEGTVSALNIQGASTGVNVFNNRISNISNTNTGGWGSNGIQLASSSTTANIKVYNNFVWDVKGHGFAGGGVADNGYGMVVSSGAGYDISFNTINLNTDQTVTGWPAALNVTSGVSVAGAINLRNNILVNNQTVTSGAGTRYAIYSGATSSVFGTINHNDYYSAGTNLGNIGATDRATLADIVTGFGGNANSLNVAPVFVNPVSDMHLTSANAALKAGTPIAGITVDIDNNARNLGLPTIGADEIYVPNLWSGAVSTVWDAVTTGNWDDGVVPAAFADVTIPMGVPNMPAIAGATSVNNVTFIGSGATLSLNGQALTITGAVTGAGTLTGSSTSDLLIGGATTLNFTQTTAATRSLNNFTLQTASANATLGNAVDIYGTVQLVGGAQLHMAGQNVTLKSNTTNTARIADLTGQTLDGATNVTMERWIKLRSGGIGRAYRLLTPTVNTTGSMRLNWMENGLNTAIGTNVDPVPLFGTQITGAGGNANGFDKTASNASSVYATTNAATPTYTAIGNTSGTMNAKTGYFLYVRGDRNQDMTLPLDPLTNPTSSTTLRATGTILQGTQTTFTNPLLAGAGVKNLVTNPYPSAIDWSLVYGASTDVTTSYTFWDPNFGNRGGFVTVNTGGVASSGAGTQFIQSGQAFFVESLNGNVPTVSIQEGHKVANNNNGVFLVDLPPVESFRTELYYTQPNGFRRVVDGAIAVYNNSYSAAVDAKEDASEINNWDENIAIARDGKRLAIESRPVIGKSDDLPIFMNNMKQQSYEFEFTPVVFTNTNLKAELIDNYLGTRTLLSVTDPTVVAFKVTADAASKATDRFKVVFGAFGGPQGIDAITIKASQQNDGVQVDWASKTETDMLKYEVEKSTYGTTFVKANSTPALGNSTLPVNYNWFDANPNMGTNFYRVKGIDKAGNVRYSEVVRVMFGKGDPRIVVYPNPMEGNTFKVDMYNLVKGIYLLNLYNSMGQLVYTEQLQHDGSQATRTITVKGEIGRGAYQLQLSNSNGFKTTHTLIKN